MMRRSEGKAKHMLTWILLWFELWRKILCELENKVKVVGYLDETNTGTEVGELTSEWAQSRGGCSGRTWHLSNFS
jgi:hypothetical protein